MCPNGLKRAPGKAPERLAMESEEKLFGKEIRVQVHRIENTLDIKDPEKLKIIAEKELKFDVISNPMLFVFLDAYKDRVKLKTLIESFDGLKDRREKLLYNIRKLIYKTKLKEKEKRAKKAEKIEKQITKSIDEMTSSEILNIEDDVRNPFEFNEKAIRNGKVTFDTFQKNYKKIFNAQRLLSHNMKGFTEKFEDATTKLKNYNKKNKGWKSHVFGIYYWAKSKISSSEKKKKKRANAAIEKARKYYKQHLERGKELKKNIKKRSQELKVALNIYRNSVREKLKKMISKKDWTQEREEKSKNLKDRLSTAKETLLNGLEAAKQTAKNITETKTLNRRLKGTLKRKIDDISASEYDISRRIDNIRELTRKIKEKFPPGDPRRKKALEMVGYIKTNVVSPLVDRKTELQGKKFETKEKYIKSQEGDIKMEMLKADVFLQKHELINNLERVQLGVQTETAKIERLSQTRETLLEEIEKGEIFYMVTDEFKESMWKNLDKVMTNNDKAFDVLGKQYDYLKKAKASDRGFFTSIYNTAFLGKFGVLAPLHVVNNISRIPSFAYNSIANWSEWEGWSGFVEQWDETEKWSVTGMLGQAAEGVNKWIEKGGVRQYEWFKEGYVAKPLGYLVNVIAGLGSGALDIVNGLGLLVLKPWQVADGIVDLATSWKKTKAALKQVIHYHHWDEGRYGIATGKTALDAIALILSGGVGAGMKSASASGKVGKLGKIAAFMRGFGRYAVYRFKNVPAFAKNVVVGLGRKLKNAGFIAYGVTTGKGLSIYRSHKFAVLKNKTHAAAKAFAGRIDEFKLKKLEIIDPDAKAVLSKIDKSESTIQGIKSLTNDELTRLLKGLNKEFMTSKSVRIQAALDKIGYSLQNYLKYRAKQQAVEIITTKHVIERSDDLIKRETPKGVAEQARMAYKMRNTLDEIDEMIKGASGSDKKILKAKKNVLRKKYTSLRKKLNSKKLGIGAIKEFYEKTDEFIGKKPGLFELWQKKQLKNSLKDQIDVLKRKSSAAESKAWKAVIDERLLKLEQELQKIRYFDMLEVNRLLKVGSLKDALSRLRSLDRQVVPKSVAESLLKFIAAKLPLTSAYIGRIEDLWDPKLIERIPKEKLQKKESEKKVAEIRREFIRQVNNYYKIKPKTTKKQ
jgi:hypothetical protein